MGRIRVLGDALANKIAAGEVVERPASVVKELVENSIDAGATSVQITVEQGGKELIRVEDNGDGIASEDVLLAFERHATSKLQSAEGLFSIYTLGFRGEALPSIASVSKLSLTSKVKSEPAGSLVEISGGKLEVHRPTGATEGTSITVRQLFFNTPARYKFLKQDPTEKRYILDTVTQMAMAHPEVKFTLTADGKELFKTPGDGELLSVILSAYGKQVADTMAPLQREKDFIRVRGYVSKPTLHRGTRKDETVIVNGRVISSRFLASALEKGYQSLLPSRRFPVAVLEVDVDPTLVDVNVHPAKAEVRFQDESQIYRAVLLAVKEALLSQDLTASIGGDYAGQATHSAVRQETGVVRDYGAVERGYRGFTSGDKVESGRHRPEHVTEQFSIGEPSEVQLKEYLKERDPGLWQRYDEVPGGQSAAAVESGSGPDAGGNWKPAAVELFQNTVPLGQWLNTYMILADGEAIWLVDQHIAHERVLYERLSELYKGPSASQPLLVPLQLELSPREAAVLGDHMEVLAQFSFGLEEFGGNTYLIREVPLVLAERLGNNGIIAMVKELIEYWEKGGDKLDAVITTMSCRGAVKAGDALTWQEMEHLLMDLSKTANPFTCPHGRPIIVKLTLPEVERRFGRR